MVILFSNMMKMNRLRHTFIALTLLLTSCSAPARDIRVLPSSDTLSQGNSAPDYLETQLPQRTTFNPGNW